MSGFVAVFGRDGTGIDRDRLRTMHEAIAHRGPDGGGTWDDGTVGLGHQRLVTTPEARVDEQPHRADGLVVAADARIDNREELLATLLVDAAGGPVPDSRLLLAAYRRWGRHCVDHLVGSFSFAVWDQTDETLFCARDRFGVKPLYYHRREDLFAVASEPKALLSLPSVPGQLDETKIGDFLTGLFEDEVNTFYESINRLPPAHAARVTADGASTRRYWSLDPTRTLELDSDAAYERRFRELFDQAVGGCLRRDGAIGTDLSGGLDSSSVTAVARDLLPADEPLHAFSNVFDDAPSSDERRFIESLTDRPGIESHYVFLDDVGSLVDADEMRRYFDQPPHNTMHFGGWEKTERAADVGVDAVLSGALGDSAVDYGLGLLPELFRTGRWRQLLGELRAMGDVLGAPTRSLFKRHALVPMVPASGRRGWRRLRGEPILEAAANPALDQAFVDRIGLRDRYRTLDAGGSVRRRSARRWQRRSLRSGTIAANFETVDLCHAAFGVEPRHPFADKRLVEFSLAIPPTQQLADGWTRSILRRSLDDVLPDRIQWRPWKTGLNAAFWNALAREDDRLRSLIEEPGRLDRYVDAAALRDCYERFRESPDARDARTLWRTLSLATWLGSESDVERPDPLLADGRPSDG